MVLFIILYMMVVAFESVDQLPKCDHSNEIYAASFSRGQAVHSKRHKVVLTKLSWTLLLRCLLSCTN